MAGAVSGNCGGSTFAGRGNRDARCLRRPKPKRAEPTRAGWLGRGVVSKEMWTPELPSDLDDSEALVAGGAKGVVLSTDSRGSASTSGWRGVAGGRGSASSWSSSVVLLVLVLVWSWSWSLGGWCRLPLPLVKARGLRFRSMDLRSAVGLSVRLGSKERLRRASCCMRLLLGVGLAWSSWSGCEGAVVMMAGAVTAVRQ